MIIDVDEKKIKKAGLTLEEYLILNVLLNKPDISTDDYTEDGILLDTTWNIIVRLETKGFIRIIEDDIIIDSSARELVTYKYKLEIEEVLNHLNHLKKKNGLGNREFKSNVHSRIIRSRLAEKNYSVEEIQDMISMKFNNWIHTEFERYLRPATLFAKENFYKYMDEVDYEYAIKDKQSDMYQIMKDEE